MKKNFEELTNHKVKNHVKVDPYKIKIERKTIGVTTKKAMVFYNGEPVGELEEMGGLWYIPGSNPKAGWEHPMYPADLITRRWIREKKMEEKGGSDVS